MGVEPISILTKEDRLPIDQTVYLDTASGTLLGKACSSEGSCTGRIRTCTSFLMDDLANRSANHYGTAPLRIQVVLSHHLARTGFLRVLSIELLYLSHHSRDSNPGTLYGQSIFKIAFSSFRTYGIVNCSIFPNS